MEPVDLPDLPENDDPTLEGYALDLPGVKWARGVLMLYGVLYLLSAIAGPILATVGFPGMETLPPDQQMAAGWGAGLTLLCCDGVIAILVFVTASNLAKSRAWAWYVALAILAIHLPSCFLPFSAFGIYGLVREDTRNRILN